MFLYWWDLGASIQTPTQNSLPCFQLRVKMGIDGWLFLYCSLVQNWVLISLRLVPWVLYCLVYAGLIFETNCQTVFLWGYIKHFLRGNSFPFFPFIGADSFPGCFWTIQKSFRAKDAAVHHNTGPEALQGTPHANLSFLASQGHCFIGSDSTYISVKGRWEKLLHPFRRHYAQRSLNPDLGMGPGMPRGV